TDLGVIAAKAALERSKVDPEQIDQVIFGNVLQTSGDAVYLARHIGLKSGVPIDVPALTINRLCGSGLQAIQLGQAEFVLAGGTENMSMAPHQIRGARWGLPLGEQKLEDYLWVALIDSYNGLGMANTAENLGRKYGISRDQADEFAERSHRLAAKAREDCRFSKEIVPVEVKQKKGNVMVDKDEHIRPDTTREGLAKLVARFEKGGTVTAGTASGINDGAAAMVVASAEAAAKAGLKPIARIVSGGVCGVDPDIMGIGPAPSSRQALQRAGLKVQDMDLVEINEAFATQYLAVEKDLGLDRDRSSARRIRRAACAHARVRATQARQALWTRVALHRWRPGDRGGHRARLEELTREALDLADLLVVVAASEHEEIDAGLLHGSHV